MNLRLALSRLESAETRAGLARTLALLCVLGYIFSLAVLFAAGIGLERWLFVLLVWALLVYLPLRILLEAFQTIAPAIRRTLINRAGSDPARYRSSGSIELIVDGLFKQDVLMPRIAKPQDAQKAREGSAAVLRAANQSGHADLERVSRQCLGTVEQWTTELSAWTQSEAQQNIQARWGAVRALASFAALTKIVLLAAADRAGRPISLPDRAPSDPGEYLDTCLDYCDRLALEVDAAPWTEPRLGIQVSTDDAAAIRVAWTGYVQIPPPAIDARNNFVKTLLGEL
jgi:hypothetical protein